MKKKKFYFSIIYFLIFAEERSSCDFCASPNNTSIHDDRSTFDDCSIFDSATMDDTMFADVNIISNLGRIWTMSMELRRNMNNSAITNRYIVSNSDGRNITCELLFICDKNFFCCYKISQNDFFFFNLSKLCCAKLHYYFLFLFFQSLLHEVRSRYHFQLWAFHL